jgi:hypothetical protein
MTIALRLTRSQQMALIEILVAYTRSGEPQEFVNVSNDPETTTTVGDLLTMISEPHREPTNPALLSLLKGLMPLEVLQEYPPSPLMGMRSLPRIRAIRTAADSFAHHLRDQIPITMDELALTLWTFGELTNGMLERQLNAVMVEKLRQIEMSPFTMSFTPCRHQNWEDDMPCCPDCQQTAPRPEKQR